MGGVGERSEPPAGGLAVGAEGSVNSEFSNKTKNQKSKLALLQSLSLMLTNRIRAVQAKIQIVHISLKLKYVWH